MPHPVSGRRPFDDESSLRLLERVRAGEAEALETLLARYRPRLVRWARGRLGPSARGLCDTEDLVQNTLIKAVRNLETFQAVGASGFQHYLRMAIANAVRDEIRNAHRRPAETPLSPAWPAEDPSPLERAIGKQRLARYEAALATLTGEECDAIIARFEFGFTHDELAVALGKPSADAARKLCARAIQRLLVAMDGAGEAQGEPADRESAHVRST
jgi:RNA polymerase sigma-70 factor (ECF subfamily)